MALNFVASSGTSPASTAPGRQADHDRPRSSC